MSSSVALYNNGGIHEIKARLSIPIHSVSLLDEQKKTSIHHAARSKLELLSLLKGFVLCPPASAPPDLAGLGSLRAVAALRAPPLAASNTNGFGTVYV